VLGRNSLPKLEFHGRRPMGRRSAEMGGPAQLAFKLSSNWGGARENAGRRPFEGRQRRTPHRARPEHKRRHPVHVTLRARTGLPSLRSIAAFAPICGTLSVASRESFRVIHYSVQRDHVHLIVEADDKVSLEKGIRGLVIRMARAINRGLGRKGAVWGDRYHTRALETPIEVRYAIRYVLLNHKKHGSADRRRIDPRSSALWFDGFKEPLPRTLDPPITSPPKTWLARKGWKRHGLISLEETPLPYRRPR
jgi:REP-associated tyrosine transposase